MQFFKKLQRGHADYKITVNRRIELIKRVQIGKYQNSLRPGQSFILYIRVDLHILNSFHFILKFNSYNQVANF